jgi:glycosyltransferase involved in cell wall biosynthesis
MVIGVDISQIAHEGTGVARYVAELVRALVGAGAKHQWVLFGASLRKRHVFSEFVRSLGVSGERVRLVTVPIPPTLLEPLWNTLHIIPIEWFIGRVDVFWSSDWTQPPLAGAKGVTTIHDVSFLRYAESFPNAIVEAQKRRLRHAARKCEAFFCDSEATRQDVAKFLKVTNDKLHVVYPGYSHL